MDNNEQIIEEKWKIANAIVEVKNEIDEIDSLIAGLIGKQSYPSLYNLSIELEGNNLQRRRIRYSINQSVVVDSLIETLQNEKQRAIERLNKLIPIIQ